MQSENMSSPQASIRLTNFQISFTAGNQTFFPHEAITVELERLMAGGERAGKIGETSAFPGRLCRPTGGFSRLPSSADLRRGPGRHSPHRLPGTAGRGGRLASQDTRGSAHACTVSCFCPQGPPSARGGATETPALTPADPLCSQTHGLVTNSPSKPHIWPTR